MASLSSSTSDNAVSTNHFSEFSYPPPARRDETVVETYHKERPPVVDPYRWLEDPDSDETKLFVEAQNKLTFQILESCEAREKFRQSLTKMYDYPKYGCPFKRGNKVFYFHNSGLQAQFVLYMQVVLPCSEGTEPLLSEPTVLLDPNRLSSDGSVSIGSYGFSEDGKFLAVGLSEGGSDWQTIRVLEVDGLAGESPGEMGREEEGETEGGRELTGERGQEKLSAGELGERQGEGEESGAPRFLDDELKWVKFTSVAWTHDGKGFFYNRYKEPASFAHSRSAEESGSEVERTGEKQGRSLGTETDSNKFQMLYYHVLGTNQSEDVLMWRDDENDTWTFGAEITDDGKYLLLTVHSGCDPVNKLYYVALAKLPGNSPSLKEAETTCEGTDSTEVGVLEFVQFVRSREKTGDESPVLLPVVKLVDNFDAQYSYVANDDSLFVFKTNQSAPLYKLVTVDLEKVQERMVEKLEKRGGGDAVTDGKAESEGEGEWSVSEMFENLVAEHPTDVLEWANCVNNNQLLLCYLKDVKNVLQVHSLHSGTFLFSLPLAIGSVTSATGRRRDREVFYSFSSFLTPKIIYRCDLSEMSGNSPEPKIFREAVVPGFDPSKFKTEQVFVPSKDGTVRIPMFIILPKSLPFPPSLAPTLSRPTLLYGYGGFNISLTPSFSLSRSLFLSNLGGVVAISNVRGGGEYGEKWHEGGKKGKKPNTMDDFISCAEFLVSSGLSSPPQLAIEGGSNGGMVIAACMNKRPDLFGCCIAHVGVMDMLRFQKFTIGHAWTSDFGCSEDDVEQFDWLRSYSPLHNVRRPWEGEKAREGGGEREEITVSQYPSVLLLTGDHDDRVVPLHSLKYIATLQHELIHFSTGQGRRYQTNPVLARVDIKSGHGAGKPTKKWIEEASDVFGFIAKATGAAWVENDAS